MRTKLRTSPYRKLGEIMRKRGITTKELASLIGVSPRTIHSIACGNSTSRKARQLITNVLREQIWPDIIVTERLLVFDSDVEIESPTTAEAIRCARQFPKGFVKRFGTVVRFIKPLCVTIGKP